MQGVPQPVRASVWTNVSTLQRRLVKSAVILDLLQLFLVDVFFRYQQLPEINAVLSGSASTVPDGIGYLPLALSGLVYAVPIGVLAAVVNSKNREVNTRELSWLGTAWLLATIPLVLDLLIDTFEVKWPVILLFAWVGFRYWSGIKNSSVGLVLAPTVAAIATQDFSFHFSGEGCLSTGLDTCSAKAVSDIYLVMMLLVLIYVTIRGRDKPPGRLLALFILAVPVAILATSVLGALF